MLLGALVGSFGGPMDSAEAQAVRGFCRSGRFFKKSSAAFQGKRRCLNFLEGAYFAAAYNAPTLFQSMTFHRALR